MTSDLIGGKGKKSPGKTTISPYTGKTKSPVKLNSQRGGSLAVATVPAALFVLKVLLEKLKNPKKASDATGASAPRKLSVRRSAPAPRVSPRKSPRASPAPSVRRKLKLRRL